MANQPQYKSIADGHRYLANMAIGLADDDYRSKFGVIPGTNLSEFGQWIDSNRESVYSDAQSWFTYIPPTTTQPPITTTPPTTPAAGGGTTQTPFPGAGGSGSGSGGFELPDLPGGITMWIIGGGLALFFLMRK
jgi:hypothetical protein